MPPVWTITAAFGLAYVIVAPYSADLAAATYRSDLFGRAGFTLWDNAWYAGHHLLAYSVLAPALGWLIGPRLLAALSMTIATALFAALIEGRFPARATRIAALWFALGASVALLSSRVAFDVGLAIGLGALLSAQRRRRALALALAPLSALASPVAGAFLALAALAWALAGRPGAAASAHRPSGSSPGARVPEAPGEGPSPAWRTALAVAALAPIALLALLFPEGGSQPFDASSALPALAGVLIVGALIPARERALRAGALLYAVALAGAYVLTTPVGGNADRLGALFTGPIAACVLAGRSPIRRRAPLLIALAPFLLYWQVNAPASDFASAASDPSVHASYYAPLLGRLSALGASDTGRPLRIEVAATANHWEASRLAPHVALARGWERQLDRERNALFYDSGQLTAARYRAWLLEEAVAYVALPDAPLDYSARSEARLLRGASANAGGDGVQSGGGRPPAYLREVWRSVHWRLFAVLGARPLTEPPAVVTQLGSDSFTLQAPRAGALRTRIHFTPYWALASGHGCVRRAPGDWTELQTRGAGSFHVVIDFSLARVFDHGPRCR